MDPTILQRVALRGPRMCAAASDEGRIPEMTTVPVEYTEDAARAFIERQWARTADGLGWSLAIARAHDGEAVGCIVLLRRPQHGVAGVGYWVIPEARGRRYAARAVRMITEWALGSAGLERVEAWVEPGSDASVRVLVSCGYSAEGRLRSFLAFPSRRADALVFSRVRGDEVA